ALALRPREPAPGAPRAARTYGRFGAYRNAPVRESFGAYGRFGKQLRAPVRGRRTAGAAEEDGAAVGSGAGAMAGAGTGAGTAVADGVAKGAGGVAAPAGGPDPASAEPLASRAAAAPAASGANTEPAVYGASGTTDATGQRVASADGPDRKG